MPILSRVSRKRKLRLLLSRARPGSSILEVGAGSGWFADKLRAAGHRVMTLDLSAPADVRGDIKEWRSLGLREESFDGVVALELIEHVDCWRDLKALCRPGGWIFLSSPSPRYDWVCGLFETARLTQRRTSEHVNLVDFAALDLSAEVLQRPLGIHQVGLFRKPA